MENLEMIEELWAVIQDRKVNPKKGSYTNSLLADEGKIIDKLREELAEVEEAVRKNKTKGKDSLVWETSDLLYHLLVLLAAKGVELEDVLAELKRRRG
jgi:phosphoribosyl-ATP pyrophosphohydrolase